MTVYIAQENQKHSMDIGWRVLRTEDGKESGATIIGNYMTKNEAQLTAKVLNESPLISK